MERYVYMKINQQKLDILMAKQCIDKMTLAEKAGLKYPTIRRACQREGTRPSTVGKIAKALDVDVTELLED